MSTNKVIKVFVQHNINLLNVKEILEYFLESVTSVQGIQKERGYLRADVMFNGFKYQLTDSDDYFVLSPNSLGISSDKKPILGLKFSENYTKANISTIKYDKNNRLTATSITVKKEESLWVADDSKYLYYDSKLPAVNLGFLVSSLQGFRKDAPWVVEKYVREELETTPIGYGVLKPSASENVAHLIEWQKNLLWLETEPYKNNLVHTDSQGYQYTYIRNGNYGRVYPFGHKPITKKNNSLRSPISGKIIN